MSREIIYLGRSNTIDWQLQADGAAVDLSSVTRMTLEIGGEVLDSATQGNGQGNTFYWTSGIPATGVPNLYLALGPAAENAGIAAGNYNACLVTYDPDNLDGIVWLGSEPVTVI